MASFTESFNVGGLVVFGTVSSLLAKIIYELQAPGRDGHDKPFHKPWACTTMMFVGMTFCLPLSWCLDRGAAWWKAHKRRQEAARAGSDDAGAPLLRVSPFATAADKKPDPPSFRNILMLAVPMAFDLIATILLSVGLLTTTASVSQMLRGSGMVFSALFAVWFLKRSLNRLHYWGIAASLAGMGAVGAASLLSGDSGVAKVEPAQMILGMALIVASQATQSAQCVAEDFFMSEMDIPALTIVGMEGLFGCIALFGCILPIAQFLPGQEGGGLREDSIESWHMITHDPTLMWVTLASVVVYLAYNTAGMYVTEELGAVTRTVLETMRTLFVWAGGLALYYSSGTGRIGERWDNYSYFQAIGFAVLAAGTVVYGRGDDLEATRQTTAEGEAVVSPPLLTRTFTKRPMWKATHSILATVHAKKFVQRLQEEAGVSQARQAENGGSSAVAAAAAGAWQRRAGAANGDH
jgi:drug/metabolite transporter (DMT)-like permease